MTKISVTVECNSPQEAQAVIHALSSGGAAPNATPPQPAYNPPAPAANYAPPPAASGGYAPPAQPGYPTPPAGGYAPPPGAPAQPPAPPTPAGQPATGAITETQLAQAAQAYAKAYTPKAAKAVFAQLGVKSINEIPKDPVSYQRALAAFTVAAAA